MSRNKKTSNKGKNYFSLTRDLLRSKHVEVFLLTYLLHGAESFLRSFCS